MKLVMLIVVAAGCSHWLTPATRVDRLEERSTALRAGTTEATLAYARELEIDLRSNPAEMTRDARFPGLLDGVLAALDRRASVDRAAASELLATKAAILDHVDRRREAAIAASASLALRPSFMAFKVLGGARYDADSRPDRSAFLAACRKVRPSVAEFLDVCYVLQSCTDRDFESQDGAEGDAFVLSSEDQQMLERCRASDRRWAAFTKQESENRCIAKCRQADATCTALPETCVGELRRCLADCLPR